MAEDGPPKNGLPMPASIGLDGIAAEPLRVLERARLPQSQHQLRIERRVVVRVGPSMAGTRPAAVAAASNQMQRAQLEEVEHTDCVAVDEVSAVQPIEGNRLLLVMQDRYLLTVSLERNCVARAFYSGFYVERHEDGKLCVARDRLQSRAGASCEVSGFSRLVAVSN